MPAKQAKQVRRSTTSKPKRRKAEGPSWPAHEVERRKVGKLVPYARNARTHTTVQIAQIAASIREWGWTNPILIDEADTIIAGHGRILAAELLAIEEVPVVVARGWSDTQKRAYVIADNKLTLEAGWDQSVLALEFRELRDMDFNFELTGFSAMDVDKMLADPVAPDDFKEVSDDIETNIECPRCNFKWSASGK